MFSVEFKAWIWLEIEKGCQIKIDHIARKIKISYLKIYFLPFERDEKFEIISLGQFFAEILQINFKKTKHKFSSVNTFKFEIYSTNFASAHLICKYDFPQYNVLKIPITISSLLKEMNEQADDI